MATDLHCRDCGRVYEAAADEPWRCECGHPLDFADRPVPARESPPDPRSLNRDAGLWAFRELLPVDRAVSMAEGFTPLVADDDWDAQFKLEYLFPSGSYKDRGATTMLSRAASLGVEKVIEDSSGNAGAAVATYAARAGMEADIYVPADVKQSKLVAIQRAGARPIRVEGSREDVTDACVRAVETGAGGDGDASEVDADADAGDRAPYQTGEGWYASHAWNPAFYAGTMTFAFEVTAQRGWTAPDAVVTPLGHGTLLLGAYRGFRVLEDAGYIDEVPRMLAAQAAGYAPIAAQFHDEDEEEEEPNRLTAALSDRGDDDPVNEVADGIRIRAPAREEQVVDAIERSGGDAVAVDGDAVEGELDRLHRAGFYVEPTSAAAPAALREYRRRGVVAPEDDVVVPLTGSGMKTL